MIWLYRKSLVDLISKLKELKKNKDNLGLLLNIQESLIKKLVYLENRISRLNQEFKRINKTLSQSKLPKIDAKKLKDNRDVINFKIGEYNWLLFVFRTIGDGLAFSYLDKWNIKPLVFKDTSPEYKQKSGFISGKSGLGTELKWLRLAIEKGIPAILTDLTNSIRYGDICLMGGSIPKLIEVKSSNNRGNRVFRQRDELKHVQSYLDTDVADGLRGYPKIRRFDMYSPEINYAEKMNELIDLAVLNQFSYQEIEPGIVYYVQTADANVNNLQNCFHLIKKPIFYYINTLKNESNWVNYYPFTLSIEKPQNVYQFLSGEVQIIVLLDFEAIEEYAKKKGFEAKVFDNEMLNSLVEAYNRSETETPFNDTELRDFVGGSILFIASLGIAVIAARSGGIKSDKIMAKCMLGLQNTDKK